MEVKILSDWIANGENQKGKVGNWDIEFLKSINIEYERKKDVRKLSGKSDNASEQIP